MNAKHTPGPWQWQVDSLCPVNPDPNRSAVSQILRADGGRGFLGRSNSDTMAELEADRRLIAAAPMLLEALKKARPFVASSHNPVGSELVDIDAAIAAATQLDDTDAAIAGATQ